MSETPRSDEEEDVCRDCRVMFVSVSFAQELERELAQMTRERDEARKDAAQVRELMTLTEDELRLEVDRLRAEVERLRGALESIKDCCEEDHAVRGYTSRETEIRGLARFALQEPTP